MSQHSHESPTDLQHAVQRSSHHTARPNRCYRMIATDLVKDYRERSWDHHKYLRFDLADPLAFDVDLSGVPCGCVACVYMVAMSDPSKGVSNYCDMAQTPNPGIGGGLCTELDIFEANSYSLQSALHTQLRGSYGSGNCDSNGCFSRIGGPMALPDRRAWYGHGNVIDSTLPFRVQAEVDHLGEMKVTISQNAKHAVSFDKHSGGNPQGRGVPYSALRATSMAMKKLALVASLWTDKDTTWLNGKCPQECDVNTASFTIANLHRVTKIPPPSPPAPIPLPPSPCPLSPPAVLHPSSLVLPPTPSPHHLPSLHHSSPPPEASPFLPLPLVAWSSIEEFDAHDEMPDAMHNAPSTLPLTHEHRSHLGRPAGRELVILGVGALLFMALCSRSFAISRAQRQQRFFRVDTQEHRYPFEEEEVISVKSYDNKDGQHAYNTTRLNVDGSTNGFDPSHDQYAFASAKSATCGGRQHLSSVRHEIDMGCPSYELERTDRLQVKHVQLD